MTPMAIEVAKPDQDGDDPKNEGEDAGATFHP
jgi:hypothetical protein